jgi:cell division protein FtsQ
VEVLVIAEGRLAGLQRRRLPLPRPSPAVIAILVGVVILLGGAWLWLRDSSLVSVNRVSVSGQSGPDAAQIRTALISAARNMTTLDVRMDQLRTAVAPYPVVKDLRVSTQFPHGMRIRVIEQVPVGAVSVGGRTIAVAGDGTLLHDVRASSSLPAIPMRVPPGGTRIAEPDAVHAVELLAAAPYPMIARISQVTTDPSHGLVAQLRNGPSIYFGDPDRLAAKWIAATAVLTDPGSAGAAYIDVTDPGRPAAGAGTTGGATGTTATGTTGTGTTGTATTAAGTTGAATGTTGAATTGATTSPASAPGTTTPSPTGG